MKRLFGSLFSDSTNQPNHPVFEDFPGFKGLVPAGFSVTILGGLARKSFGAAAEDEPKVIDKPIPKIGEEYFEWISVLESVKDAKDSVCFVHLGASFGRWACSAALAARRLAKSYQLYLIEPEPTHQRRIVEHLSDNDISPDRYKILPIAAGPRGVAELYIEMPEPVPHWYGQAILDKSMEGHLTLTDRTFDGHPIRVLPNGFGTIQVTSRPLDEILSGVERIDLINCDVMGSEADAIESAPDYLNGAVRRIHIGTYSRENEARLRRFFSHSGWRCVWDYPCHTKATKTPYGTFDASAGLQNWINPRLAG